MTRPVSQPAEPTAAEHAIARHREQLKQRFPLPSPVKKNRRPAPATLGIGLMILGLAAGLWWLDPAYRTEQYATARGQVQRLALADGSVVTLDGASQVTVGWHLRSRRVQLLAGQALFEVAPATYRPFQTQAGAAQISVLGTRYNVSRHGDDARVSVEQGKVRVAGADSAVALVAGQQVLVSHGRVTAPGAVDVQGVGAWTEGRLVFDRTPLGEVLDAIERHTGLPIALGDPGLAQLPVTGSFDSQRLDSLLSLLPKVLPVELSRAADGSPVLNRRAVKK
ncbi:FecR domain-containing protein [Pseudomonas sp. 21LCFQ02]|uniref:FecR family protein n=1 Tax=Pseudomonas sp. 21LCFQ02 TaxID=2957505 RepID=UPI00209B9415|nr:FecR domain-containing protein [Pseudomonas sp. 21LCFQ02]MCO8169908.1 FecR domain-containing protein [Pseudomonas sp. 21LCFQ02]